MKTKLIKKGTVIQLCTNNTSYTNCANSIWMFVEDMLIDFEKYNANILEKTLCKKTKFKLLHGSQRCNICFNKNPYCHKVIEGILSLYRIFKTKIIYNPEENK